MTSITASVRYYREEFCRWKGEMLDENEMSWSSEMAIVAKPDDLTQGSQLLS